MYKVFVVEDEIVTREGIRNNIPWDETVFTLVGEAPDGEMALHALRDIKPDILITDIKMPFMDGLALSRIVKNDFPWIKIIILSGHDEFEYAKEAISIGVEEYMLKPISASEMMESLMKVARIIEEEKEHLNDLENLRLRTDSIVIMEQERWFMDLISGQMDTLEILKRGKTMGLELVADSYIIMAAQFSALSDGSMPLNQISPIISGLIQNREDVLFHSRSMDKYIILIKHEGIQDMDDRIYSLAQAIKHEIERKLSCRVSLGIGTAVNRLAEIYKSYNDAEKVLRYLLLSGQNTITAMHDLKGFSSMKENNSDFDIHMDRLDSKHQTRILQAKKYIEENYMNPDLSLNSVSAQVNVSSNHFSTIFSQEQGLTFIEYLTSVRIKYAKQLLSFSKMKCFDITYEVGYRDPHYFSFIFKKNTGISPREFRTQFKKKGL